MLLIVNVLGVIIEHIRAGVRERPRRVAVESDDDVRRAGNGHTVDVERAGNDEMRLVPDGRQREIEVRVAGEQRVTR